LFFFFDLDGPILDVAEKYHRAYSDVATDLGLPVVGKDAYWQGKRERQAEWKVLGVQKFSPEYRQYTERRIACIESPPYQQLDTLQPGALDVIKQLKARYTLVIVTMRNQRDPLLESLQRLGVLPLFDDVLNTGHHGDGPRWRSKYDLVREVYPRQSYADCWYIGDTDTDILAGHNLGCRTIAVTNGIRTPQFLEKTKPHAILASTKDLLTHPIYAEILP